MGAADVLNAMNVVVAKQGASTTKVTPTSRVAIAGDAEQIVGKPSPRRPMEGYPTIPPRSLPVRPKLLPILVPR